ncbi:uncharacterized protein CcaverHIS019_0201920 [Cutaneotrichosporon cavernicola]|uniref:RING-type domain-containing protein n=1 Tax=Cutaneotrichosporon cavernicola TaxID=279322 RepID=A0AA48I844_9TREE|nr:uncharacterized protein CcaverHIS019_0201920 [Cutaneotrichosporon cavernicola]BEI88830.1 hypothetical protein CcaverHIS019_0201920 [Cutaneotrichosporon cavernicola]BEJ04377.1 hypothetical protein CcaverHIS641_0201940 [Cutaneotrichosporon cavernicola]
MEAAGRRAAWRDQRERVLDTASFTAMSATFIVSITLLALASRTRSPDGPNLQTKSGRCHKPSLFVALLAVSTARLGLCIIAKMWVFHRRPRWQAEHIEDEHVHEDGLELEPYVGVIEPCVGVIDEHPDMVEASSLGSTHSLPLPQAPSECAASCEPSPGLSESEANVSTLSVALATASSSPRQHISSLSIASTLPVGSTAGQAYPPPLPLSSALAYPEPSESNSERWLRLRIKCAATADVLAVKVINSMAIVHVMLWILGSVACFSQIPNVHEDNCYRSAPLLWWPLLFTTILFGWLHAVYYAYMVIGSVILLLIAGCYLMLAHLFGWPVRPFLGMVRPRTPQPEKLTEDDLKACPVVAYVPDPSEPLPEPSIYEPSKAESLHEGTSKGVASTLLKKVMGLEDDKSDQVSADEPKDEPKDESRDEPRGEPVPPGEVDPARLRLRGVILKAHQVTCAICQSSFVPPREVPGQEMYEIERLRQLPCKHVFHVECVDNWLTNHSGICPYCSQNVKDLLKAQKTEGESAPAAPVAPAPANPQLRADTSLASLTRDLAALALKPPSKRKQRTNKKNKVPEFRYRVGAPRPLTRPSLGEKKPKPKGHVHVRIEPRSRRHAMHRRHRVPSPTPTV